MMTTASAHKLVVISDIHLGNPFSKGRDEALSFLKWASSEGFDICINGDGLEIAQVSFDKLAQEIPVVVRTLKEINKRGTNVYYVVGNHDIALENFLEDWGSLKVCPFLNLNSGFARIRIEHGHLYDPFFIKFPNAYEVLTRLAGVFLEIHPSLYKFWINIEKIFASLQWNKSGIPGELSEFQEAANEICRRGFDAVIFGHTHHMGEVDLPDNKKYYNSGSWLMSFNYLEINNGIIQKKFWSKSNTNNKR
ncbi:MAG: UDP-2,3-diacylglucosamine diphosphatase [Bacteriovoracaceae bacterium]|nr:UDP-2,3-diacylglucosamine diphosphatase [Bacteriovoracaceae bacterium]